MKLTTLLLLTTLALISCQQNEVINPTEPKQTSPSPKGCTKEAKICPDGRSVSRNPLNNCEFDSCQKSLPKAEEKICTADVKQCPDGSFVGRDGFNDCKFGNCPPTNNGRGDPDNPNNHP